MTLPTPRSHELPQDTVLLDGPESIQAVGGVAGLMKALHQVLQRPGPAVVVATSGSTGRAKHTVLDSQALQASAQASAAFLHSSSGHGHGPGNTATNSVPSSPLIPSGRPTHGQWLLCLPAHYVAGAQVLVRSLMAGTDPVVMADERFTPTGFVHATGHLSTAARFVSLVPTQLQRLVSAAGAPVPQDPLAPEPSEVADALRSFSAILLGGSAATPTLLRQARDLGAKVVTTYGMSETAGGCMYDGLPLSGVDVRIEPDHPGDTHGRIWLGGPMVTSGYLDDPAQTASHMFAAPPQDSLAPSLSSAPSPGLDPAPDTAPHDIPMRWYRTDDLGAFAPPDSPGMLRVTGRADDVLITGGVKVSAGAVRLALVDDERVEDAVVVGVPDVRWGQRIVTALVPTQPMVDSKELLCDLAESLRAELGAAAVPKDWRVLPALPLLPTGKPDPHQIRALFT